MPRIIAFDTETTGLNPEKDEVLQLAIVDENGSTLFNEYFKPQRHTSWDEAERIHMISPQQVQWGFSLEQSVQRVSDILNSASTVIGYNVGFDVQFLQHAGVSVPRTYDVMKEFSEIYGEWNEYFKNYKWQSLSKCAEYYGYKFSAHNALEDAKATVFCYRKMKGV